MWALTTSSAERTSSTADVLEHHLTAFGEQDISEYLADYSDDSVIVSNVGTSRGLHEIQALAEHIFPEFAQDGVEMTVDTQEAEGEIGYAVWHAETPDNVYEFGTDTLIVRNGVIDSQTFAVKVTPKN